MYKLRLVKPVRHQVSDSFARANPQRNFIFETEMSVYPAPGLRLHFEHKGSFYNLTLPSDLAVDADGAFVATFEVARVKSVSEFKNVCEVFERFGWKAQWLPNNEGKEGRDKHLEILVSTLNMTQSRAAIRAKTAFKNIWETGISGTFTRVRKKTRTG